MKKNNSNCHAEQFSVQLSGLLSGLLQSSELIEKIKKIKSENLKIVFTNGCFDILHPGHLRYLNQARNLGDVLIAGINSDLSVKRLKGPLRPVNSEKIRAEMLLSLKWVDYVVIFEEDTPYNLISLIKPDFLVKGGDWGSDKIVGSDLVKTYGGQVVSIPVVQGFSSTASIEKTAFSSKNIPLVPGLVKSGESTALAAQISVSQGAIAPDVLAVIPARWASSRLPGKPLCDLCGKSMIQRVFDAVEAFGGTAVMTNASHKSGSDRAAETAAKWGGDIIVNVQGDEPFMNPRDIDQAVSILIDNPWAGVSTLAAPFRDMKEVMDPSKVKAVMASDNRAVYFSRAAVPFFRDTSPRAHDYYRHIGLYAYRRQILERFTLLPQAKLEKIEMLEQLRFLENGVAIVLGITSESAVGIDTPEDLENARKIIKNQTRRNNENI
jgi:3-deoxy-manno-octulosonate cytidylyltransferase (CMP-KDO synthetase)